MWATVQSIRSFFEQNEKTGRGLHLLDHSGSVTGLKYAPPVSNGHVVLARFGYFSQINQNLGNGAIDP